MAFGPNGQGSLWPIFLPSSDLTEPDRTKDFYFTVRIVAAHIAFKGGWWGDAKAYMLTTKCSVLANGSPYESKGIQYGRKKIGPSDDSTIANDIVDITPATITRLSVEVDVEVTRRDIANEALSLLGSDSLAKAFSLSASAVTGISVVTAIVPQVLKLIKGDTPAQENFCSFRLDVDLPAQNLKPGWYAGIVCRGDNQELKNCQLGEIAFEGDALRRSGNPIQDGSYIVLEVKCLPKRDLSECEATWRDLYKEANDSLSNIVDGTITGNAARESLDTVLGTYVAIQKLMRSDRSFTDTDEQRYMGDLRKLRDAAKQIVGSG
jgi:hypothetical protein